MKKIAFFILLIMIQIQLLAQVGANDGGHEVSDDVVVLADAKSKAAS